MAVMTPVSDGRSVHTVVAELSWQEACYVLACLGASNARLFDGTASMFGADPGELYVELRDVLGVEGPRDPDEEKPVKPNEATGLFKRYSAVLDAWCGRRNYGAAKRVAEEVGL